jgi:FKBP-type peptidyl-prolyl cis-trans isomerase SlyD
MIIGKDAFASIAYVLKGQGGDILDSSSAAEPLSFVHGSGDIIPGLERELEGKKKGDSFACEIRPEDAYGLWSEDFLFTVRKDQFDDPDKVAVGTCFEIQTEGGSRPVTIHKIEGDVVTIDANHPLAGKTLSFSVTVVDVRQATAEELEHACCEDGECCGCHDDGACGCGS